MSSAGRRPTTGARSSSASAGAAASISGGWRRRMSDWVAELLVDLRDKDIAATMERLAKVKASVSAAIARGGAGDRMRQAGMRSHRSRARNCGAADAS